MKLVGKYANVLLGIQHHTNLHDSEDSKRVRVNRPSGARHAFSNTYFRRRVSFFGGIIYSEADSVESMTTNSSELSS